MAPPFDVSGAGFSSPMRSALIGLAAVVILMFGTAAWLAMSMDEGESADASLARLIPDGATGSVLGDEDTAATTLRDSSLAGPVLADGTNANMGSSSSTRLGASVMEANASLAPAVGQTAPSGALDPAGLSGLRISSQSWRRGGLGSKALVTFTLRNANAFAVKDVEISCAFNRRDGSHVTDRRRLVPGEVRSRSRKTFAAVHVGFVNVNASTAKCALVAAAKI